MSTIVAHRDRLYERRADLRAARAHCLEIVTTRQRELLMAINMADAVERRLLDVERQIVQAALNEEQRLPDFKKAQAGDLA